MKSTIKLKAGTGDKGPQEIWLLLEVVINDQECLINLLDILDINHLWNINGRQHKINTALCVYKCPVRHWHKIKWQDL